MAHLLAPSKKYLISSLLWIAIIAFLCLESSADLPKVKIFGIDKLVHFGFHYVLTFLWFLYLFTKNINNYNNSYLRAALLLSTIYGILIELLQQILTTTRQADVLDVLANFTGAICAVITLKTFLCYKIIKK